MQMQFFTRMYTSLILMMPAFLFAQINETFSGNEFNDSGLWSGNIDHMIINSSGQAQLNAPQAGSSYFSSPFFWEDTIEFSFFIKLDFAPSTANKIRIHIHNENSNLNAGQSCILSIGEDGSTDGLNFIFRETGGSESNVLKVGEGIFGGGVDGVIRGEMAAGYFKIDYIPSNQTAVPLYEGDLPWALPIVTNGFFGFDMVYSATRRTLFYFDDIVLGKKVPDVTGPKVVTINTLDARQLAIHFDEALDISSATNIDNYRVFNQFGAQNPSVEAIINGNSVHLIVENDFYPYNLVMMDGIKDIANNVMDSITMPFLYTVIAKAGRFDLLINELMPDPTPVVGLPDSEFIELYNNGASTYNLSDYVIKKNETLHNLPDYDLEPGGYVVIVPNNNIGLWAAFSPVISMSSFPTLNNDGLTLTLQDKDGLLIHEIRYDLNSYKDAAKNSGGWSLEHTLPTEVCAGYEAFRASVDASGGTPGKINSNVAIDGTKLQVTGIEIIDLHTVVVCFSKFVDDGHTLTIDAFTGINLPEFDVVSSPSDQCVELQLYGDLIPGVWYEVRIGKSLADCRGLSQQIDTIIGFGTGFPVPQNGELVINELLFNPISGGVDFLELYNHSDKIFDLKDLIIKNSNSGNMTAMRANYYLRPGEFVVFCPNPEWLKSNYHVPNPNAVVQLSLPAFNDNDGNVTIQSGNTTLDSFTYDQKMHNVFLRVVEGTTLERVSYDEPTNNRSNWQSAATSVGGATPTYKNSQSRTLQPTTNILTAETPYFSPNQDGFQDLCIINYHLNKAGYVLRWRVFDAAGRQVKVDNPGLLTGTSGFVSWSGDTDSGARALPGNYIMEFLFTHPEGETIKEKLLMVISYPAH